jgi:polysaccharide export outer membrane protein
MGSRELDEEVGPCIGGFDSLIDPADERSIDVMIGTQVMRLARLFGYFFLFCVPAALAAQAPMTQPDTMTMPATAPAASPAPPAAPAVPAAPSYRIGKGDILEIAIVGRDDYRARVQVQEDGTIQLPLIGSVAVENDTALRVRDEISSRLQSGGYYVNPAINVVVVSYSSRYVTVLGQVGSPGVVPIDRAYRLSEIIARAGGVSNVSIDTITVTSLDGQPRDYQLSAIATGGPAADPLISDGDKIFVASPKTFYIYGQVNAPGNYPIEPGMTVQMALARAGGLTSLGSQRKIKLVRSEKEARAVLTQKIAAGDVIVIGEKFF